MLAATDFFTVEVWTPRGLVTYYVLFFVERSTRRIEIAGITPYPDEAFMNQIVRNLTHCESGFLRGKKFLIHDRDSKLTRKFLNFLRGSGVRSVRLPRRSPNLNAFAERFVLSIKSECLNRIILFGERSLRRVVAEYVAHYHEERPHQGIDRIIDRGSHPKSAQPGTVQVNERLGGLLKYYHRPAA